MLLERVGERATFDGFSMGFCIGSMMAARVFVRIVEDVRSFSLSFFLEYCCQLTRKNMEVLYVNYNEIVSS